MVKTEKMLGSQEATLMRIRLNPFFQKTPIITKRIKKAVQPRDVFENISF
jgi:hypothetical protein